MSFTFPGAAHPVIHNINLALTPGQTTAIIGSTGSGKTTLCRLLPRLLDPSTGRVTINGVDLKDLDLEQLRATIAFVPQQPYLFAGTIASNLLAPTPEKAWEALEYAQAAEFVRATDLGLDTPVEPGGKNFSGGQRQRLTMARAFARPAQLFIFDDSFSALDYVTDSRIRATLPAATNQAACLIVAQRVSTIRHADQIIVLDNGSIAGRGKHHELMECCPTYQEIVLSQLSLEEAA